MSPNSYLDFDLLIESDGPNYRATVLDSPAGESETTFTLPFSEKDLEILVLQVFRLTTRRTVRAIASPQMKDVRSFGGHLYESLFSGPVSTCLLRSMDEADRSHAGLRVRLHLGDAPALANIPWEFLYDSSSDGFLCLSDQTPLVRYIDLPQRVEPLAATPPLRMLCLISSPSGYPPLDVEHEWAKLNEALGPTVTEGRLVMDRVDTPSLEALQRRLRREEYHVLHFVGHGAFDEEAQDGVLLLEDLEGRGHPVSGESLGVLLHDHEALRLVVLNACEGARTSTTDPFAGTAQSLVRKGIPAVIAMQFEISDVAAITMANEFYSAVADGYPVDAALSEARKAIFTRVNAVEWATPVLYMRSPDGRIFEIEDRDERLEARAQREHDQPTRSVVVTAAAAPPAAADVEAAEAETVAPAVEPETTPLTPAEAASPVVSTAPPGPLPSALEPAAEAVSPVRPDVAPSPAEHPPAERPSPVPPPGGIWQRHRGAVLGVIAGAIALIVLVVALISRGGGPGPSTKPTGGLTPTSGPSGTALTTSPLSKISFAPVPSRDIQATRSGSMLRPAFVGGTLLAAGNDGSSGAVWVSSDGFSWSRRILLASTEGGTQVAQGIAGDETGLVAVGWEKLAGQRTRSAAAWISPDGGATWTPVPDQADFHGAGDTFMNRVAIVRDVAIGVGVSGGHARLWPSDDGLHWDKATNPVFEEAAGSSLRDVTDGNGQIVVVGDEKGQAAAWFFDDSVNSWDRGTVRGGRGDASIVSVVAFQGGFVAVGYDSPNGNRDAAVWTSVDGRTWDRAPTQDALAADDVQVMRGIVEVPGFGLMAVGVDEAGEETGAAVWYSEDGVTWTRSTRAIGSGGNRVMTGITRTGSHLIVVGRDGTRAGVWTAELPTS